MATDRQYALGHRTAPGGSFGRADQALAELTTDQTIAALGSSYTLKVGDGARLFRSDGSTPVNVTLPRDLPEAFTCGIIQWGAGVVTTTAGAGATRQGAGGSTQYKVVTVLVTRNVDGNSAEFIVSGGV